jgi:DNA-directed RNA polymerase subunit RPC12/RpoP
MSGISKPNLDKPVFKIFPEAKHNIENNKCATCGREIGTFRDDDSRKEYSISGMCQKCQDSVFGYTNLATTEVP